jgi:hypothetical protein
MEPSTFIPLLSTIVHFGGTPNFDLHHIRKVNRVRDGDEMEQADEGVVHNFFIIIKQVLYIFFVKPFSHYPYAIPTTTPGQSHSS